MDMAAMPTQWISWRACAVRFNSPPARPGHGVPPGVAAIRKAFLLSPDRPMKD